MLTSGWIFRQSCLKINSKSSQLFIELLRFPEGLPLKASIKMQSDLRKVMEKKKNNCSLIFIFSCSIASNIYLGHMGCQRLWHSPIRFSMEGLEENLNLPTFSHKHG